MNEIKENINPFSFSGFIGRKYYLLISLVFGLLNMIIQFTVCKHIFKTIVNASALRTDVTLISILQNPTLPKVELVVFLAVLILGTYVAFANAVKRFYDVTDSRKMSFAISIIFILLTYSLYLINITSPEYMVVSFVMFAISCVLLFKRGKYVVPEEPEVVAVDGEIETKKVVSFWRRSVAYFIDNSIVFKIVFVILGLIASDLWFNMGAYGIIVGLVFLILYFGIMNSSISKGQTLGKMVMGVKVVDAEGNYLSLGVSLLRAFVLVVCVTLGACLLNTSINILPVTISWEPKIYLSIIICYSLFAAFCYLFIFNFKTRQSIHDLVAKSYVVTTATDARLIDNKSSLTNIIISAIIFVGLAFSLYGVVNKIIPLVSKDLPFIAKMNKDLNSQVMWFSLSLKEQKNKPIVMKVLVRTNDINDEEFAKSIGEYLKKNYSDASRVDEINVQLIRSYTLGNMADRVLKSYSIKK